MNYQRVLVPVDFRDRDIRAVGVASELVETSDGELTLLHVIETLEDADFEEMAEFYQRLEDKARANMSELVTATGVSDPRCEIRYGKRAREIVEFANQEMCDLIVLSSHGVERQSPLQAWATVSYSVALLSPCSVLLIK